MTRTLIATALACIAASLLLVAKVYAHPAWGIVVDSQGQVYFSDLKTVWKIDAQGKLSVFRAGRDHTHDINIDADGNLYGAENSYDPATQRFFSAIWKMTPAGGFSYLLAPTENPPKGTSIWKDRGGNMYHVTYFPEPELLVLKRRPDGNVTALAGSSSALLKYHQGGPYSVGGMAFGPDDTLYFTHGANVSKLTTSGEVKSLARNLAVEQASGDQAGAGGSLTRLFGIAVDAQGNAFVADYGNRRVLKITPDNQTSTMLRAEEPWFPTGVAARGGELYILEYGQTSTNKPVGTRVRKLSPDGSVTTLATVAEGSASSESPAADKGSAAKSSQRMAETKHNIPYTLIGAGLGATALTLIVWLVWRRRDERQHGKA